jgi:hypothetical protein
MVVLLANCMGQQDPQPARTRLVDCAGGSDHVGCGWREAPCGTVQFALDRSRDGDRIEIIPGVCSGAGNFDLRFRGLEVALVGQGWTQATGPAVEISCEGKGRGFVFEHAEGVRTIVQDIVIRDCQADYGGGVWCDSASPVLDRVVFSDNKAGYAGGALYWITRGPVMSACSFERNTAGSYGPDQASSYTGINVPGFPLSGYTSGAAFPKQGLRATLLDHYGQTVTTANDLTLQLRFAIYSARPHPRALHASAALAGRRP